MKNKLSIKNHNKVIKFNLKDVEAYYNTGNLKFIFGSKRMKSVAYHEAGHSVASYFYKLKFNNVSIVPSLKDDSFGHIIMNKVYDRNFEKIKYDNSDKIRLFAGKAIISLLAGFFAEKKLTKNPNYTNSNSDFKEAMDIVNKISKNNKIAKAYWKLVNVSAESLFTNFNDGAGEDTLEWNCVINVAEELLKKNTLKYNEVVDIILKSY